MGKPVVTSPRQVSYMRQAQPSGIRASTPEEVAAAQPTEYPAAWAGALPALAKPQAVQGRGSAPQPRATVGKPEAYPASWLRSAGAATTRSAGVRFTEGND